MAATLYRRRLSQPWAMMLGMDRDSVRARHRGASRAASPARTAPRSARSGTARSCRTAGSSPPPTVRAMAAELDRPDQPLRSVTTVFAAQVVARSGRHRRERAAARPLDLAGRRDRAHAGERRRATTRSRCSARRAPGFSFTDARPPEVPPPDECPSFRDPPPPGLGAARDHELLGPDRGPARERAPAVGATTCRPRRSVRPGTGSTSRRCSTTAGSIRSRS